jgi:hypothetical protein
MAEWSEQWERMRRWKQRVWDHYAPRSVLAAYDPDWAVDDALAFFQNAYHLKDWLKNDQSVNVPGDAIENAVSESTWIILTADLCNGTKHMVLRNPRSGRDPGLGTRSTMVGDGVMQLTQFDVKLNDGSTIDVLTLALRVFDEWRTVMRSWDLEP